MIAYDRRRELLQLALWRDVDVAVRPQSGAWITKRAPYAVAADVVFRGIVNHRGTAIFDDRDGAVAWIERHHPELVRVAPLATDSPNLIAVWV